MYRQGHNLCPWHHALACLYRREIKCVLKNPETADFLFLLLIRLNHVIDEMVKVNTGEYPVFLLFSLGFYTEENPHDDVCNPECELADRVEEIIEDSCGDSKQAKEEIRADPHHRLGKEVGKHKNNHGCDYRLDNEDQYL